MYRNYFGLKDKPFSIAPDPRFLFMSQRHREALAHLLYGIGEGGGFVQLTGEVGTGKTTVCRCLLEQLPDNVDVALILNPKLTALELVATICDELGVSYPTGTTSLKVLIDALNRHLLETHAAGRRTVLIIDEAQNLSADVLEQVRLLTNLETSTDKLLQIILIGQPELGELLSLHKMRQLAQRITARYHLEPLNAEEAREYVGHRLRLCGATGPIFNAGALDEVQHLSGGVPRLINILCDRALLGAYVEERSGVDRKVVRRAAAEVKAPNSKPGNQSRAWPWLAGAALLAGGAVVLGWQQGWLPQRPALLAPASSTAADVPAVSGLQETAQQLAPEMPVAAMSVAEDLVSVSEVPAELAGDTRSETAGQSENAAPAAQADELAADERVAQPDSVLAPATTADATATVAPITLVAGALGPVLDAIEPGAGDVQVALMSRWQLDFDSADEAGLCEQAGRHGLLCMEGTATWPRLRSVDRPAILALQSPAGHRVRVLLTALRDATATLLIGDTVYEASIADVDHYWNNDYTLLWQPPGGVRRLSMGMRGPGVEWLRTQLDHILGPEAAADPGLYDESLRRRVYQFQTIRGLYQDGVAGKTTLIHLNSLSGDERIPRLSSGPA